MERGEMVVSAVSHEGFIVIFGERGSVVFMVIDHQTKQPVFTRVGHVERS